jgi:hypothetical protein
MQQQNSSSSSSLGKPGPSLDQLGRGSMVLHMSDSADSEEHLSSMFEVGDDDEDEDEDMAAEGDLSEGQWRALYDPDEDDMERKLKQAIRRASADLKSNKPGSKSAAGSKKWTQVQLTGRFYLRDFDMNATLREQTDTLYAAIRDPFPNPYRVGVCDRALSPATVDTIRKSVVRYLGFLVNILQEPADSMSLTRFGDTATFQQYLEFLTARNVRTGELAVQTKVARQVCTFLNNLLGGDQADSVQAKVYVRSYKSASRRLQELLVQLAAKEKSEKGSTVRCESCQSSMSRYFSSSKLLIRVEHNQMLLCSEASTCYFQGVFTYSAGELVI